MANWNESLIKEFVGYYNTVGGDMTEVMDEFRRIKGIGATNAESNEMTVEEIAVRMVVPGNIIDILKGYTAGGIDELANMQADYMKKVARMLHSKLYPK